MTGARNSRFRKPRHWLFGHRGVVALQLMFGPGLFLRGCGRRQHCQGTWSQRGFYHLNPAVCYARLWSCLASSWLLGFAFFEKIGAFYSKDQWTIHFLGIKHQIFCDCFSMLGIPWEVAFGPLSSSSMISVRLLWITDVLEVYINGTYQYPDIANFSYVVK